MSAKTKKEIKIGDFVISGTSNPLSAYRAINELLTSSRCVLKEAKYKVDGKTITIKPKSL